MYRKPLSPTIYLFIHSFAFGGHLTPRQLWAVYISKTRNNKEPCIKKTHTHNSHKHTHKKKAARASATTVTLGMGTKPHFQRLLEQLESENHMHFLWDFVPKDKGLWRRRCPYYLYSMTLFKGEDLGDTYWAGRNYWGQLIPQITRSCAIMFKKSSDSLVGRRGLFFFFIIFLEKKTILNYRSFPSQVNMVFSLLLSRGKKITCYTTIHSCEECFDFLDQVFC